MLSLTVVVVLKMIEYWQSCVGLKFGDEICLCCVGPCWYELMKMMVVLLMYSAR